MALTALLICLFVQRWLHFDSYTRQYNWFEHYYLWIKRCCEQTSIWSGLVGVFIILVPAWLIFILFALFVYHVIGIIGYYFFTLVILWYCLDVRSVNEIVSSQVTTRELLVISYQRIFGLIFWLLILGVVGVVMYYLVSSLRNFLERAPRNENEQTLLASVVLVEGVLDWIPLRLVGITYALVGQFSPTFKYWYQNLFTGLSQTVYQAVEVGLIALGLTDQSEVAASEQQINLIEGLVNRSLLVWLVVIALFTIGMWIG